MSRNSSNNGREPAAIPPRAAGNKYDLRDSGARFRVALSRFQEHGWIVKNERAQRIINPAIRSLRRELRNVLLLARLEGEPLRSRIILWCGYWTLGFVVGVLMLFYPAR